MGLADKVGLNYGRKLLLPYVYSINEIILKDLDFPRLCIKSTVVRFNQLNLDVLFLKVDFDRFRCHIINDIKTRFEPYLSDLLYVGFKILDNCLIFGIFYWCC